MSKSSRQALVQLAVVAGCFEAMRTCNRFSRVDIRQLIGITVTQIHTAAAEWPSTGNEKKNTDWTLTRFAAWKTYLPNGRYDTVVLVKMCERLLTTLDEVTTDPIKRRLLAPILAASKTLHDFCDPEAANFPAYEESDKLLEKLYEVIEYDR